jgi:hypothetical protein
MIIDRETVSLKEGYGPDIWWVFILCQFIKKKGYQMYNTKHLRVKTMRATLELHNDHRDKTL